MRTEKFSIDAGSQVQAMVGTDQELTMHFDQAEASRLLAAQGSASQQIESNRASLAIIYSYGDFTAATSFVRSDDTAARPFKSPATVAFLPTRLRPSSKSICRPRRRPDRAAQNSEAVIGQVPGPQHGWLVAFGLYCFMAFYAMGPGVCVWLALSELMPTRIRSKRHEHHAGRQSTRFHHFGRNSFFPSSRSNGYSSMFFLFASFTVVYFITIVFFLPETKGKTLEEIEAHFEGKATD